MCLHMYTCNIIHVNTNIMCLHMNTCNNFHAHYWIICYANDTLMITCYKCKDDRVCSLPSCVSGPQADSHKPLAGQHGWGQPGGRSQQVRLPAGARRGGQGRPRGRPIILVICLQVHAKYMGTSRVKSVQNLRIALLVGFVGSGEDREADATSKL